MEECNMLNDHRRMWKYIIFGILTLGIYCIIFWWNFIKDINTACGHVEISDDDKSPNYLIFVLLSTVTLGIYSYIWYYKQGNRIKNAGKSYGLSIEEKGSTYILWTILGLLLFGIGPLVALYLLISNVNKLCRMYNYELQNKPGKPEEEQKEGRNYFPPAGESSSAGAGYYGEIGDFPTLGIKGSGSIRCIKGQYNGAELEILPNRELVIGRNSQMCNLILPDQDISRKHCSVKYSETEGCYYVTDYSTFGVYINDSQKLEKNVSVRLPVGTKITLGEGNNEFVLG